MKIIEFKFIEKSNISLNLMIYFDEFKAKKNIWMDPNKTFIKQGDGECC